MSGRDREIMTSSQTIVRPTSAERPGVTKMDFVSRKPPPSKRSSRNGLEDVITEGPTEVVMEIVFGMPDLGLVAKKGIIKVEKEERPQKIHGN